jgi:hypothetical protein
MIKLLCDALLCDAVCINFPIEGTNWGSVTQGVAIF